MSESEPREDEAHNDASVAHGAATSSTDVAHSAVTGPGPEELDAAGDIDEPVCQGAFLELSVLIVRLRTRRAAMGLSLANVARRSKLTDQAISRLENGWDVNPPFDTLYRCALSLDAGITLRIEEVEPAGS